MPKELRSTIQNFQILLEEKSNSLTRSWILFFAKFLSQVMHTLIYTQNESLLPIFSPVKTAFLTLSFLLLTLKCRRCFFNIGIIHILKNCIISIIYIYIYITGRDTPFTPASPWWLEIIPLQRAQRKVSYISPEL